MRLNSLHLLNFRQHADTRIEFDLGLTGIIGANGSGKSTILEAIAWALYGQTAARGTRESIRFARAGARAQVRVELDFELGGHRYRVVRGLTSAELYLDNSVTPIANSLTGVTDLLQRRLGMSQREFFNTYFTGQKELAVMAAMQPAERAKFLSQVLGYEKLKQAQDLVREHRGRIVAEANGLRAGMPDAATVARMLEESSARLEAARQQLDAAARRVSIADTRFAEIGPRFERMQEEREQAQRVREDLRVAELEEQGTARDLQRIGRELGEIEAARAELARVQVDIAPLAEIHVELTRLDVLAREEGRRAALLDSARGLEDELARLRDRKTRLDQAPVLEEEITLELEKKRHELEDALGRLEAVRTEWVRDRQEAETKLQALRAQYAEARDQRERLVKAGEEGACPTCARPLGGHYRQVLELLDEQIETLRVDGNYYRNRIEQLGEMPEPVKLEDERRRTLTQETGALERRLAKCQLGVQELSLVTREIAAKEQRIATLRRELEAIPGGYDAKRHDFLRSEVDRLAPLDAKAARLDAQIGREAQLRRENEAINQRRAAVTATLANLRARAEALGFSQPTFEQLREEFDASLAELRASELAAMSAQGDVQAAEATFRMAHQADTDLKRTRDKLDDVLRAKRLHDELDRAYSDIRTDLNLQLRPEISELASSFLVELTDARYSELELDDQYRLTVLEEGVPKPVISGGEEDLANLVFRLAISQMIAERAGQELSLLILDEVFGSLDESRRQNVVELLRRLGDRFEQVVVITHIESVREGLDRVIEVSYDEATGASRVTQGDGGAGGGNGGVVGRIGAGDLAGALG
ncbi:MAG TPA: SMC family ATPase [Gemmatimonadaceae bacterium]|nr:SMC family ATPase [Gemmatimonadaceae bacterium]